jgi:hypothetical protein
VDAKLYDGLERNPGLQLTCYCEEIFTGIWPSSCADGTVESFIQVLNVLFPSVYVGRCSVYKFVLTDRSHEITQNCDTVQSKL